MNIYFTEKQNQYISTQIQSGDYQNASEVIRDALRLHEFYRQKMLEDLRLEIDKGWNSPVSNKSVQDILAEKKKK